MPAEVKEEWEEERLLALALLKMEVGEGDMLAGPLPVDDEEVAAKIALEIEQRLDYEFFKSEDGIASPFLNPEYAFKDYRSVWSFYTLRLNTLRLKCNRRFDTPKSTNALTLYLVHLFYAAKYKGRDHMMGIQLVRQSRHPGNVSFGKVVHNRPMDLGYKKIQPASLDDFDEASCNVIPECWATNYFRLDNGYDDLNLFLEWLATEGGRLMFPEIPHGDWQGLKIRNQIQREKDGDRNGKNRKKTPEVEIGRAKDGSGQSKVTDFFSKGKKKAAEPIVTDPQPVDLTGIESDEEEKVIWVVSDSDEDQPGPSTKRQKIKQEM